MKQKMIYIPFKEYKSIGGPVTFMRNLKAYLDGSGFSYQAKSKNAKGIFFPISYKLSELDTIKQAGGSIIQRLDGIYYPSKHGSDYTVLNRDIKNIYNHYADFVIFQSEYSKKQCLAMLGPKSDTHSSIIVNGVNKKLFFPQDVTPGTNTFRFITTGNFRNADMLEPVISALDHLYGSYDFELVLIGPVVKKELLPLCRRPYVKQKGKMKLKQIALELQKSRAFIYSHLNPPCPNSVLEAVSCGLPVVGFDSGAMSELLFFSKELLAPVSDEIFQKYEDFEYKKLTAVLELLLNNYSEFRNRALEHAGFYSFEECGRRYVEVFERF